MDESRDALKPGVRKFFKGRKAVSEAISHTICGWLTMSLGWVPDIEDSCLCRFDLTKLAFALAAYRADHGAYPARLADLSPKYAATVPKDRFTDGDLHYSLQGSGYCSIASALTARTTATGDLRTAKRAASLGTNRHPHWEAVGWDRFRHSDFPFRICFGFRVSDFGFCPYTAGRPML